LPEQLDICAIRGSATHGSRPKEIIVKATSEKKNSSPQLGIKHIVLCVIVLLDYILDLTQPLF
jgi:hypothetical protein